MTDMQTRKETAPESAGARRRRPSGSHGPVSRFAILGVVVVLIVLFSVLAPSTFPRYDNFTAIVSSDAPLLLLALAVTTALRAGDFDLSVSASMTLSAAVSALIVTDTRWGAGVAIVCAIGIALCVGIVNAILVVGCGLDSFITTLGTMTAATGIGYAITGANVVSGYGGDLTTIARAKVAGIPAAVIVGWVLAIVMWYVFQYTAVGRQWLFTGGNRQAAELVGLRVNVLRASALCTGAVLSGVAGVLLAGSVGSVDPSAGGDYLLTPFAAAFLGTVSIAVGRFNVVGTLIGLYTLAIGESGLQLLGAPTWITNVFDGGTLVVALGFAAIVQRGGRAWLQHALTGLRMRFG